MIETKTETGTRTETVGRAEVETRSVIEAEAVTRGVARSRGVRSAAVRATVAGETHPGSVARQGGRDRGRKGGKTSRNIPQQHEGSQQLATQYPAGLDTGPPHQCETGDVRDRGRVTGEGAAALQGAILSDPKGGHSDSCDNSELAAAAQTPWEALQQCEVVPRLTCFLCISQEDCSSLCVGVHSCAAKSAQSASEGSVQALPGRAPVLLSGSL